MVRPDWDEKIKVVLDRGKVRHGSRRIRVEREAKGDKHDITYLITRDGWLYLAVIIDLQAQAVIGRSMGTRMTAELVCGALKWRSGIEAFLKEPAFIATEAASTAQARMARSLPIKGNCRDTQSKIVLNTGQI